ncbi:hypothetical protein T484DRAFT_1930827 [Baffinella frigidus]|nr:hypothetical protein T484DRAFT_1930827 [Cryptophyta sp. CCMP2293]
MHRLHPRLEWYFLAGCDTYVFPAAIADATRGVDGMRERVLLGGHAGVHTAHGRGTLFLSGGSGLLFSNALVTAFAPVAPALLRRWLERDGAQARCAPCADIAFAHFAELLGARLEQRPCFYAFWPQYYVAQHPGGAPGEIAWRAGAGGLPARCAAARVDVRGLGVSASSWWARTSEVCGAPVAFHYLQPRAMRLLHRYVQEVL